MDISLWRYIRKTVQCSEFPALYSCFALVQNMKITVGIPGSDNRVCESCIMCLAGYVRAKARPHVTLPGTHLPSLSCVHLPSSSCTAYNFLCSWQTKAVKRYCSNEKHRHTSQIFQISPPNQHRYVHQQLQCQMSQIPHLKHYYWLLCMLFILPLTCTGSSADKLKNK